jgi:hypothetical protein
VLWAWERPESLLFADSKQIGVAFLAESIFLDQQPVLRPRLQPLSVSRNTPLIAVVRLEATPRTPGTPGSTYTATVAQWIANTAREPQVQAVQIDFDVVPPPFPSFLTASERASADDQRSKLAALAAGPVYMGRVVLDWAKAHPDDQRLPEALHLVVRATRYGCSDNGTAAINKQAFDLLHARYPNSTWATQTPYWFK